MRPGSLSLSLRGNKVHYTLSVSASVAKKREGGGEMTMFVVELMGFYPEMQDGLLCVKLQHLCQLAFLNKSCYFPIFIFLSKLTTTKFSHFSGYF